jgi:hypothetical protein
MECGLCAGRSGKPQSIILGLSQALGAESELSGVPTMISRCCSSSIHDSGKITKTPDLSKLRNFSRICTFMIIFLMSCSFTGFGEEDKPTQIIGFHQGERQRGLLKNRKHMFMSGLIH